ncbi:MAG: CHASE2 domain-containing protein, partial [Solirubrobacterales bacterium]
MSFAPTGGEGLNRVPGVRQRRMSPRRRLVIASVGLLAAVIGLFTYGVGAFDGLEETTIDTRFAIRGDQVPPDELIVVGIDDDTFSDLELQFPFPRSLHAKVVDELVADRAAVIAYDVQFTEPTSRREDNALVRAVWSAPAITLATTEVTRRGEHRVLGGEGTLEQGRDARAGDAQIELSDGGVLRELPPNDTGLDLFPIVVAEQRGAAPIAESSFPNDRWIDFFGPPGTIPSVSFSDVAAGDFEPGTFEGKTVFVGAMASSLQDSHKVPTADDEMFGVEYQATATATIEAGFPLRSAGEL